MYRLWSILFLCFCTVLSEAQSPTSSNLPIFFIDTFGSTIQDDPKVDAGLKIINNPNGARNNITDALEFDGKIGVEYRGSSSQMFPKKSLGFEIRDKDGKSTDAALLGFPKDEDWILFASYNEKSLIHNTLAMKMARDMGVYASRTKHVELFINGDYQGVYVLMERIKRTATRANVTKMSNKDNSGDVVTGGYVFKIDKTTGSEEDLGWISKIPPVKHARGQTIFYLFDYPKPSNITIQQQEYLHAYVDSAEAALNGPTFKDKATGYRRYFDTKSFISIFLTNEVTKNIDGYRISTFFTKDRTSKGGKIKAGPAWDYDLGFANCDYCEAEYVQGWSYLHGSACADDDQQVPFHWSRMLEDPDFVEELKTEYLSLRAGPWKTENLMAHIDSVATVLTEAQGRNFAKWPVLGTYLWPNPRPIPATWPGEVSELKSWLTQRLSWMDSNIPGLITGLKETHSTGVQVILRGNPVQERLFYSLEVARPMQVMIEVLSGNGTCISRKHEFLNVYRNDFSEAINLSSGIYYLRVHTPNGVAVKKMVRQ